MAMIMLAMNRQWRCGEKEKHTFVLYVLVAIIIVVIGLLLLLVLC